MHYYYADQKCYPVLINTVAFCTKNYLIIPKVKGMRLFSLILSIVVFIISLYFFVLELPVSEDANEIIFLALLVILMIICIVGVIINWSLLKKRGRNTMVFFVSNGFSKKKHKS